MLGLLHILEQSEKMNGIHEVMGSIPISSTNSSNKLPARHPRRWRARSTLRRFPREHPEIQRNRPEPGAAGLPPHEAGRRSGLVARHLRNPLGTMTTGAQLLEPHHSD